MATQDAAHGTSEAGASLPTPVNIREVHAQMVRLAFKDTVRLHGVPSEWIGCEVRMPVDANGSQRLQVILALKRWSGHLLRYSMAFQKQMLLCLDRYEPGVDHLAYEWMWRYAADCDCPFPDMPPPEEWKQKLAAKAQQPKPPDLFERRRAPRTTGSAADRADKPPVDVREVFAEIKPKP